MPTHRAITTVASSARSLRWCSSTRRTTSRTIASGWAGSKALLLINSMSWVRRNSSPSGPWAVVTPSV